MFKIDVIIATFRDAIWQEKARIAMDSVLNQTVAPNKIHMIHGKTLADARNEGAKISNAEWLLFLDADDTLDNKYISEMTKAIKKVNNGNYLLRPASVTVVNGQYEAEPKVIEEVHILLRNYMIIGTLVKRDIFLKVGGFYELLMYEDWDLWIRCFISGCESYIVPEAIYEVTDSSMSRNKQSNGISKAVIKYIICCYWEKVYHEPYPDYSKFKHSLIKRKREIMNFFQKFKADKQ